MIDSQAVSTGGLENIISLKFTVFCHNHIFFSEICQEGCDTWFFSKKIYSKYTIYAFFSCEYYVLPPSSVKMMKSQFNTDFYNFVSMKKWYSMKQDKKIKMRSITFTEANTEIFNWHYSHLILKHFLLVTKGITI